MSAHHASDPLWREKEAEMFRMMGQIEDGFVPSADEADYRSPSEMRRVGYFVEMVSKFRKPPHRPALDACYLSLFRKALDGYGGRFPVEAVVPGGSVSNIPQWDELAEKWGFHPGLDIRRYRSETSRQDQPRYRPDMRTP